MHAQLHASVDACLPPPGSSACVVPYYLVTLLFSKGLCPHIVWRPTELLYEINYFSFSCKWSFLVMCTFLVSPLPPLGEYPCALAENVFTPEVAAPKLSYEGDYINLRHKPAFLAFTVSPPWSVATVADCNSKTALGSQPSFLLFGTAQYPLSTAAVLFARCCFLIIILYFFCWVPAQVFLIFVHLIKLCFIANQSS